MNPYGKAAAWLPHSISFTPILKIKMLLLWTAVAMLPLLLGRLLRTERSLGRNQT